MDAEKMSNIKKEFATRLNVHDGDENKKLSELGLDSLDVVELLLDLENEYSIQFSSEEMKSFQTVKDLYNAIESKL